MDKIKFSGRYYTIPSDNRELQQMRRYHEELGYYTIPSDNRELQQEKMKETGRINYTIPSDNRELQRGGSLIFR